MTDATPGRPSILLVEDNDAIRNAFTILLEESGYRVLQAGSGNVAIQTARSELPDLVILDLGLPDVSGLEVARTLRARPETGAIPIVALTGRALEVDEEACMAAGCSGYLTKPIDTEQLLRLIPTFIGNR
ncbi:MAG: response regulator [Gemmatimonadota bacterium]|nr:response regulator [Gemmatimonadota bacterium]